MSKYDNNKPLNIPPFINGRNDLTATQKYHLALLYQLTRRGYEAIDFLSGEQSRIVGKGVFKKDVRANIKLFVKMGFITTEHNPVSKNEEDMLLIKWVYTNDKGSQDGSVSVKAVF